MSVVFPKSPISMPSLRTQPWLLPETCFPLLTHVLFNILFFTPDLPYVQNPRWFLLCFSKYLHCASNTVSRVPDGINEACNAFWIKDFLGINSHPLPIFFCNKLPFYSKDFQKSLLISVWDLQSCCLLMFQKHLHDGHILLSIQL